VSDLLAAEKTKLIALLGELSRTHRILAPAFEQGIWRYAETGGAGLTDAMPRQTDVPPKELFLPQTECVFYYTAGAAGGCAPEVRSADEPPSLVVGVRPCDARALTLLDRIFETGKFRDPGYARRRANSLIMAVACDSPGSRCFCTSTGGGPFDLTGADLLLVDAGQVLAVAPVTEKGQQFVAQHPQVFTPGDSDLSRLVDTLAAAAKAALPPKIDGERVVERLGQRPDPAIWDAIQEACIGCSACSYLCPTCHCFDIVDEVVGSGGARMRTWDSCAFPTFVLEASGFDPRPSRRERLKNRVLHKFSYMPDNIGLIGCVGCGRCIDACPSNLDIRDVLLQIEAG
jgi:sulfhydrogenase subunit beta (sulfur reductase)